MREVKIRPDINYKAQGRIGILLINIGTPEAPTTQAIKRYLAEFLWDPRVVRMARLPWWCILHGWILPFRSQRSTHLYEKIWTDEGSPLLVHSQRLTQALQTRLGTEMEKPPKVVLGMRYGQPSIPGALERLRKVHAKRIVVLPLYPQSTSATVGSAFDAVAQVLKDWQTLPEIHMISEYAKDPDYTNAIATSIQQHRKGNPPSNKLIFSFHGLPKNQITSDDYYYHSCQQTAARVAKQLGLQTNDWHLTFQSRMGRQCWLQPYTDEVLASLPSQGHKRVDVVCPGFAVDCLETLEEIALHGREIFLQAGGQSFHYIPALNDTPHHVDALCGIIRQHFQ